MDQNKTGFTLTSVEFSNELDPTCDRSVRLWVDLIIVVVNGFRILVVFKLPVVESIPICILKQWLTISDSISSEL
jgi:hypothetical protein